MRGRPAHDKSGSQLPLTCYASPQWPKAPPLRLGVNVDHVATLRNARRPHPDPVRAALVAIAGGADGITAHLRETAPFPRRGTWRG